MSSSKKGSDRNQIRKSLRKLKKQIGELEKLESPPEPLNKGKPIFIKRNIYLKKKFKKRVKDHGIFCSCSLDPGSSTICGSDCNCGILLSSCSSSCKCSSECTNKPFQQRHIKKMKLVQTEKCGYGIVADEDINSGEFIIEYVGEVIDEKICEERLWKLNHKVEKNFYLCQINWNMVIDATHKGNKSRYINHSCNPNTEMQKWIIDGETRIGIFATRFINKGEQLTYDYQFVQFGADQDCYCGAVCCRKKLGAKPCKTKRTTSEEAVKPVACKVTWKTPKGTRGRRIAGKAWNNISQRKICCRDCIGAVIWLARPMNQKYNYLSFSSICQFLPHLRTIFQAVVIKGQFLTVVVDIFRCFGIITQYDEFSRKHLVSINLTYAQLCFSPSISFYEV
ncbi:putative histone-lysine N-methyltransferase ASHH4 isoform X2 [Arabidopsis lyrata subsp. lyrata]|uniref:putative histone-lysine N-methyltransferase ASHH4 isoform X2 n=1 Tax=Arabidopsis lyrata subsp. lyrata TaxID=81972 RepID=UPI000A29B563|nr:putative histone-lysine N-methyltransferase ASHH4 isoform X2 [Arabidopsis lyrata subsp. lyrata]|eukprot:XP_020881932.1 putative histone-lysine N-methyltransferase ASHH4 isoform X2 [Arabidopsis lyrata subsp. lyrata]